MIEVSASTTIRRSPQEVFSFVTDLSNLPKWVRGAKARLVSGDSFAEGALFEQSSPPFGKVLLRVKNYRANEGFETESVRAPLMISTRGEVRVERFPEGTRFTVSHRFVTPFFLLPLEPLLRRRAQRESEDAVTTLRAAIERP
jgi:uncharacterized protein YndB with AHSA1/START domain